MTVVTTVAGFTSPCILLPVVVYSLADASHLSYNLQKKGAECFQDPDNSFSLLMKLTITLFLSLLTLAGFSQTADPEPAYKRFPTLPPLQLLLGDSTTKYTKADVPKKKAVLILLFSPDCSHCQHTAEELYARRGEFRDIHIIMATAQSITQMNNFVEQYKLNEMPSLTVGKDLYYILPPFYDMKSFPYMAFYNKKGNLIMGFEGSMPVARVLEVFRQNK